MAYVYCQAVFTINKSFLRIICLFRKKILHSLQLHILYCPEWPKRPFYEWVEDTRREVMWRRVLTVVWVTFPPFSLPPLLPGDKEYRAKPSSRHENKMFGNKYFTYR